MVECNQTTEGVILLRSARHPARPTAPIANKIAPAGAGTAVTSEAITWNAESSVTQKVPGFGGESLCQRPGTRSGGAGRLIPGRERPPETLFWMPK